MIQIDDTIISLDVFEKHFVCDLNACKGACCVEGDSGAPITDVENKQIESLINDIKPYMRSQGVDQINKNGVGVIDIDGDLTTSLIDNKECSFVVYDNGIAKCSIEHAYLDGKINFKKPLSCNLFPIRIKELSIAFIFFLGLQTESKEIGDKSDLNYRRSLFPRPFCLPWKPGNQRILDN